MLHLIAILTTLITVLSGIYVLGRGEWRPFALKFAGIVLSTLAAVWLLAGDIMLSIDILTCPQNNDMACMMVDVYRVVRNLAFIILHIAIGRDAIYFKKRDRRGTLWQTNSSNRSSR